MNLEDVSIIAWLQEKTFINEMGRPITFDNHFFLYDIYRDWSKEQAVMKCSQIGESTERIIKCVYACKKKLWNVIYTLPTSEDVGKFVRTKVNKMMEVNRHIFGRQNKRDTDNVGLKAIGDRFLMFQGTISRSAAIMATADVLIHDEIDRSDLSVIADFRSRVKGADSWGGVWKLSNPSYPEIGIHKEYLESDMKRWHIKCGKCDRLQALDYTANVDVEGKRYVCRFCAATLTRADRSRGRWIAKYPERDKSGYHISHLMAPWISAAEVIKDVEGTEVERADPEYAHNFVLGIPYEASDVVVGRTLIMDNWTRELLLGGKTYLGVDVGRDKHFTLRNRKGVFRIGTFEDWEDLDILMNKYDVATAVIDALPETTMSQRFCQRYPGRAFMCYYTRDRKKLGQQAKTTNTLPDWLSMSTGKNQRNYVVSAQRSRGIGDLVKFWLAGDSLISVERGPALDRFCDHWRTVRRMRVKDEMETDLYQWTTVSDNDHYVHSDLYSYIAALLGGAYSTAGGAAVGGVSSGRPQGLIEETEAGTYRARLKDAMADSGYVTDD